MTDMRVRFDGGPQHGQTEELDEGTVMRQYAAMPDDYTGGPPPDDLRTAYVYYRAFEQDEDGVEVFRYTDDPHDPGFQRLMEFQRERREQMFQAAQEGWQARTGL